MIISLTLDISRIDNIIRFSNNSGDEVEIGVNGETNGDGHLDEGIGHYFECKSG